MELEIKTVSFGGYDKKAVEAYIEGQQEDYEKQITKLKEDTAKLSEAVKGLQQMREVNKTETDSVIDNLKSVNEKLENELERMKVELEDYKKNSRTLFEREFPVKKNGTTNRRTLSLDRIIEQRHFVIADFDSQSVT